MDARSLVKILAALAVLALLYRAWSMRTSRHHQMTNWNTNWNTNPYYGMDQEYAGQEYDMEEYDLETDLADNAEDLEDDYAVGDDDEDDEDDDDGSDDYEDDTVVPDSDLYAPDDYEDDAEDDYEDDYEVGTSSMSRVTMPNTPIMSPSSQLLPQPSVDAQDFAQYAPQNLESQNFLTATQWIGVNTQGSSLRNANYDIRSNPIIPKEDVGPWMQSTIDPDVYTNDLFTPIHAM